MSYVWCMILISSSFIQIEDNVRIPGYSISPGLRRLSTSMTHAWMYKARESTQLLQWRSDGIIERESPFIFACKSCGPSKFFSLVILGMCSYIGNMFINEWCHRFVFGTGESTCGDTCQGVGSLEQRKLFSMAGCRRDVQDCCYSVDGAGCAVEDCREVTKQGRAGSIFEMSPDWHSSES